MARATKYHVKNLAVKDAEPAVLDVETIGNGRYNVTIDGQKHEVESITFANGAVSMLIGGQSFAFEFEDRRDEVAVSQRGQTNRFDVADDRTLRLRAAAAAMSGAVEGRQTINAPMPGKIVKIFVKVGDEVTEGQGLVVVEAMKMENELKSPKAGTVTEVLTKEGVAVENGAPLVVVE